MINYVTRIAFCLLALCLLVVGRVPRTAVAGDFDFERYHDFEDFEQYLLSAARRYPHIAQLKHIGNSRQGHRLLGLKIGSKVGGEDKPAVWIDGGNHAREWPAFHISVYFIDKLLDNYGTDERITGYIDKLNIYIFPVLNPDGFIFSRTSTKDSVRQWRKNMAPMNCSGWTNFKKVQQCCDGVGPIPFSEPETRAVRDFVLTPEINGKVQAMVSLHTHGQLFIVPYNFQKNTYPEDYKDLESLARRAANAIYNAGETEYKVGTAADMFGPATGGAIDWIKMNTFIKYVFVIELPPPLTTFFAFQMRPHWLVPTAKETFAGIEVIFRQVIHEFS